MLPTIFDTDRPPLECDAVASPDTVTRSEAGAAAVGWAAAGVAGAGRGVGLLLELVAGGFDVVLLLLVGVVGLPVPPITMGSRSLQTAPMIVSVAR
jgi:hypothetical protein